MGRVEKKKERGILRKKKRTARNYSLQCRATKSTLPPFLYCQNAKNNTSSTELQFYKDRTVLSSSFNLPQALPACHALSF